MATKSALRKKPLRASIGSHFPCWFEYKAYPLQFQLCDTFSIDRAYVIDANALFGQGPFEDTFIWQIRLLSKSVF